MSLKILGIIPARYESTRFPGKPLVNINEKSMIQRVYEQCQKSTMLTKIVVATDDVRIFDHVHSFGGVAIMTKETHQSGTERCGEVLEILEEAGENYDILVNIQGDEPFINPKQIDLVCNAFLKDDSIEIATLVKQIDKEEELFNPNVVKAVLTDIDPEDETCDALYFSRQPIPYQRGVEEKEWLKNHKYYKHIGIYAFAVEEFYGILDLESSTLEKSESLEQLRWLSNHYTITVLETNYETFGIDTPEDLKKVL